MNLLRERSPALIEKHGAPRYVNMPIFIADLIFTISKDPVPGTAHSSEDSPHMAIENELCYYTRL